VVISISSYVPQFGSNMHRLDQSDSKKYNHSFRRLPPKTTIENQLAGRPIV
jgi:hypothetical protein